jgi:hypothetical protein
MIQSYAFLAMFAVQITLLSVWHPPRFIRYARQWADDFGSGEDYRVAVERFAVIYRAVNIGIAVLGALLLGWQLMEIQEAGLNITHAIVVSAFYNLLQMSPPILSGLYVLVRYRDLLRAPQEGKRQATLRRRGLFDYVSPAAVFFSVASYFGFIAFAIYLDRDVYDHASLSRQCIASIVTISIAYAAAAIGIYQRLYGRKNPFVKREDQAQNISGTVKGCVYAPAAGAWFIALFGVLGPPGLVEWRPFAFSTTLLFSGILTLSAMSSRAKPDEDEPRSASEVAS